MANQDFDTVIINPLERPVSSDLDALQSQLNRTIRDVLSPFFAYGTSGTVASGFVGNGFKPTAVAGQLKVQLSEGLGFQATSNEEWEINGIVGLDDRSPYKPLLLSQDRLIDIAAIPAAGLCRRDLLLVKWDRTVASDLTYSWNAGTQVFGPTNRPKNMTFDLYTANVQYLPYGSTDALTSPFVYKIGQEVVNTGNNSFLTAPVPSIDAGYVPVAIFNVSNNTTSMEEYNIVDYRQLLMPYGKQTISASINVSQIMGSVINLQSSTLPGAKVTAFYPAGASTLGDQQLQFVIILPGLGATGANNLYQINNEKFSLVPAPTFNYTVDRSGDVVINSYGNSVVAPNAVGTGTVNEAIAAILNGTDTDWECVNPINATIGQRFISMGCYFGDLLPNVTVGMVSIPSVPAFVTPTTTSTNTLYIRQLTPQALGSSDYILSASVDITAI